MGYEPKACLARPSSFFLVRVARLPVPYLLVPPVSTMSEEAPPAEPPTKQMAEVRLDADGKPLSKNALKKLLKAEKAAKAKAEKEAKRVRLLRRSNKCRAGCITVQWNG